MFNSKLLTRTLSVIAVTLGASFVPSASSAGTITFLDLTDSLSVSFSADIMPRVLSSVCMGEVCTVTLAPPSFAGGISWGPSRINIYDSPGGLLSDTLSTDVSFNGAVITFTSDSENGPPLVPFSPGFTMFETGLVQNAAGITWGDPGTPQVFDTIAFQSDLTAAVPEPSSSMLLVMGLFAVSTLLAKRRLR